MNMKWISVFESLPEHDCFCDVWCKSKNNESYGTRYTDVVFDGEKFKFKATYGVYISHWMPLPPAPGEG